MRLIGPDDAGKSYILSALVLVLGEMWPTTRAIELADFYAYSDGNNGKVARGSQFKEA